MFSSKMPDYRGALATPFTPFDKDNQVNYDLIEPYARKLKAMGVKAILVNSTSGEGMSMSVEERKKVTEKWSEMCKKLGILLMVQITGCPFADVFELAMHAASLKVDGVLCLPELYFKPKTIEKLVQYLKNISVHCQSIPLYYYHIPVFSGVDLPMASFMELARKEISSFTGIIFASGDLEKGVQCLKHGQVFHGSDTILVGALAVGYTNAVMTSYNIKPETINEIFTLMKSGNIIEAQKQQKILNDFIDKALAGGNGEWAPSMKVAHNEEFKELNMGPTRKPQ